MKTTRSLIAAPTGLQPGGYVRAAYAERVAPKTPSVDVEAERSSGQWRVALSWSCPVRVERLGGDPGRFVDAAALLAPGADGAPWISMGAPGLPVEGILWRADRDDPYRIRAEGLGSVERSRPPEAWSVSSAWQAGAWRVEFTLAGWPALDTRRLLAVAIWRGAEGDRGGLKSVTQGWIELPS